MFEPDKSNIEHIYHNIDYLDERIDEVYEMLKTIDERIDEVYEMLKTHFWMGQKES
jgi:prefoldin subunit 5